jgi:hypothetical protein
MSTLFNKSATKNCAIIFFLLTSTVLQSTGGATGNTIAIYKFTLTECLGEKLIKPATFIINDSSGKFSLDFNNGKKIIYTLISGNKYDPLCGLNMVDSW